jgi:hypothetical protein
MQASQREGAAWIAELAERFPGIHRSIILKTDLLREGIRYSPLMNEIGSWAIPQFLFWNPGHDENPKKGERTLQNLTLVPWKLDFSDGTPVKVVFRPCSPYAVHREGEAYVLLRDGEPVETIRFEQRPGWFLESTDDGTLLGSIFQPESAHCILACVLRYCEYRKSEQQCRFCCLDSAVDLARNVGIRLDMVLKPSHAAQAYQLALEEGPVDTILLTGGTILDESKEAELHAGVFHALSRVREDSGACSIFRANSSCLGERENRRFRDAGVDVLCYDMEVWDERLWACICPGKESHVGRPRFLERLAKAVELFGVNNVQSNFVAGISLVCPEGFQDEDEALASELEGFEWCLRNGIVPRTSQWQNLPGTRYSGIQGPQTEYFLKLGYARHKLREEYRHYVPYEMVRGNCERCGHAWTDDDYFLKWRQAETKQDNTA